MDWTCDTKDVLVSDKDLKLPEFDKNKKYFSLDGNWIGE
ncbi:hypothetical protein OFQ46_14315 [Brachyspira hyodysenteriae]|nr:hypothetical protein [Brachyspira hyodysenteriae]